MSKSSETTGSGSNGPGPGRPPGTYWGVDFYIALVACGARGKALNGTISAGTRTRLRRGFRGGPVDVHTAKKVIDFFNRPEFLKALSEENIALDRLVVRGDCALNDIGQLLLKINFEKVIRIKRLGEEFTHYSISQLCNGAYMTEFHIKSLASILFEYKHSLAEGQFEQIEEVSDLYVKRNGQDDCYPQAYSRWTLSKRG